MKNYSNAEIKQFFAVARKLKKYCNDRVDTVLEDGDDACKDCPFLKKGHCVFSCGPGEWKV